MADSEAGSNDNFKTMEGEEDKTPAEPGMPFFQSVLESNTAATDEIFSEQKENESGSSGHLSPDSSGIAEPTKSPSVSPKDTVSDADMNDLESFNDSAIPSSCLSESSAEAKSNGSVAFLGEEKEDGMSVDQDELEDAESVASPQQNRESTPVSSSKDSPGSKRLTSDDEDSPRSKRKTTEQAGAGQSPLRDAEEGEGERAESGEELSSPHSSGYSTSSSSEDDDENDNVFRLFPRRLNPRRRRQRSGTDSSQQKSDDGSSSDDDDRSKDPARSTSSNDEISKVVNEILKKPSPLPNWYAVRELNRREYGYSTRQNVNYFCERVQGSAQMVRKMKVFDQMNHHEGCVNALSFNRIGTLLASGSDDLNIVLWNWQRARPSLIYESGHRSNVFQAKFMPYSGDCHVISCARDGQVRLAELSLTGVCKATRKLAQHRGSAHKLALEHDSPNVFLSCGEDAVTFLFDLRDERPHKLVTTKENDKKVPLYSIHSNPSNPSEFCVGGRDHYIRVYDKRKISDTDSGLVKKFCPDHLKDNDIKANVTCACYNYNGTEILGSYNDEDVYLFDNRHSDGANFSHRYMGHRNNATVKGVNFYGPKSEFVISGSDCGNVYFWDKETEAVLNFQPGDKAGVINVLEPHPTLPILATSGLDSDIKLWMPSGGEPELDVSRLKKTIRKNQKERIGEREIRPNVMSSQMLWMIMHHFRNTARRRMREEGQELSTDDDEEDDNQSDDSDNAVDVNECAQS